MTVAECSFISRSDPQRRRWGRSLLLAASAHFLVVSAIAIALGRGTWSAVEEPAVAPLVQGKLLEQLDAAPSKAPGKGAADSIQSEQGLPAETTVFEPDGEIVKEAAARIVEQSQRPIGPVSLDELARRAATLEAISSREEVNRMAQKITAALGAQSPGSAAASQPADGPFDYDRALLQNVTRKETDRRVVITETLVDPGGRRAVIRTIREIDPKTGEISFRRTLREAGGNPSSFSIGQEDFDLATGRELPFAVINQFPLMRQLHQEAVMPLLDKLTAEPPKSSPPSE